MRITITGRFDFSFHSAFRVAYSKLDSKKTSFEIDLSGTTYMDRAALGMLLVLRERAVGNHADITLSGFNTAVGHILELSRFKQILKILPHKVA